MSAEQGEKFPPRHKKMETKYQGRWDCSMMGDYWWSLKRDWHQCDELGRKTRKKNLYQKKRKYLRDHLILYQ